MGEGRVWGGGYRGVRVGSLRGEGARREGPGGPGGGGLGPGLQSGGVLYAQLVIELCELAEAALDPPATALATALRVVVGHGRRRARRSRPHGELVLDEVARVLLRRPHDAVARHADERRRGRRRQLWHGARRRGEGGSRGEGGAASRG